MTSSPENNFSLAAAYDTGFCFACADNVLDLYYNNADFFSEHAKNGEDPLALMGLDTTLDKFIRKGDQPRGGLEKLLINMVETGSKSGVEIALNAGADPLATDPNDPMCVRTAMDCAERHDYLGPIRDLMANHLRSDLYKELFDRRKQKDYHTVYWKPTPASP